MSFSFELGLYNISYGMLLSGSVDPASVHVTCAGQPVELEPSELSMWIDRCESHLTRASKPHNDNGESP